jgi:glucose/arabinose dehydrogenase/cytochrome c2
MRLKPKGIQMTRAIAIAAAAIVIFSSPAVGADAAAGRTLFRAQCALCHTAEPGDGGGAQGPSLIGVFGRPAGTGAGFSYTNELRASGLTWDAATLQRFLQSPTGIVPGTSMVVAVSGDADRANLAAYFQSVQGAGDNRTGPAAAPVSAIPPRSELSADWRQDVPGRVHRIEVAALPPPYVTPSARNNPRVVARPPLVKLAVPPGFHVDVFANGLAGPRKMLVAPNGDILVSEMRGGRITVLHPAADGTRAAKTDVYSQGLSLPFGLAFYPNAKNPQWLYVAETNRVIRYAYAVGDVVARSPAEVVVPYLPSGGGHSTRDIAFSTDGSQMFVSVGSGSNVAESMPRKSPGEIRAWEATHGLGAAWDREADRAAVLVFDAKSPAAPQLYATGLRNCVSLTAQPATGALWCTTNERDALGDDLVPDYSTRLTKGGFYGWPWYYIGSHQDPRLKEQRPDLNGQVLVPDVLYQSHSAALNLTFYTASGGKSAFPAEYVGDAFAAFHGSWNRSLRTGYKLVRVHMKNNLPTGDYEDFLTGFIVDNQSVWGRPVATTELADGSLLMSEDGGGTIYRIAYSP